jgi:hypothetical protein
MPARGYFTCVATDPVIAAAQRQPASADARREREPQGARWRRGGDTRRKPGESPGVGVRVPGNSRGHAPARYSNRRSIRYTTMCPHTERRSDDGCRANGVGRCFADFVAGPRHGGDDRRSAFAIRRTQRRPASRVAGARTLAGAARGSVGRGLLRHSGFGDQLPRALRWRSLASHLRSGRRERTKANLAHPTRAAECATSVGSCPRFT